MDEWLIRLREALDHVDYGVVLLDNELKAHFINLAFCRMWSLPKPAEDETPSFESMILHCQAREAYQVPPEQLQAFVADRIALIRSGHDGPRMLKLADGRVIRFECHPLPQDGRLLTYADETELMRTVEKLERMVNTDELTQIHNRRYLYIRGQNEVARARRHGRPVSVVMLDVDHFKQVNDVYGHASGDEVLRAVAQRCREAIRKTDLVGRIGGEEFGLVLPETAMPDALNVAEKVRKRIADSDIRLGPVDLHVTASLGVATLSDKEADFAELLQTADHAMYVAKQSGRNQVATAPDAN